MSESSPISAKGFVLLTSSRGSRKDSSDLLDQDIGKRATSLIRSQSRGEVTQIDDAFRRHVRSVCRRRQADCKSARSRLADGREPTTS